MSILNQKTVKKPVHVSGVGLHTGSIVEMKILPSDPNTGIIFKRVDLKNINFSSLINDKNKCILVFTGEGSKILDKNFIYLENKFNFFKEMNFFEESVSTICQSGYNFYKKNYSYEVNIVSKKPKKNGFFEKLFDLFK